MVNKILKEIMQGIDLSETEMKSYMNEMMEGNISEIEMAAFLTALEIKRPSTNEIAGGAKSLREKALPINIELEGTLDTCGTGGDGIGTYNISTAVAIVAAAAGVPVVKHGNRSVSSKCGCADVLEACGVNISLTPEQVKICIEKIGVGFLFAPTFHGAMRHVGPVRKELGFRTIFNVLGPLANPANAKYQLIGVFESGLTETFAHVLKALGLKRGLVVHGSDGLDEITITGETRVTELNEDTIKTYTIKPEEFGLKTCEISEIIGGDREENASILIEVLKGKKGGKKDILLLNAGAALYVSGKVKSIKEGVIKAREIIDTGLAYKKLEELIEISNNF